MKNIAKTKHESNLLFIAPLWLSFHLEGGAWALQSALNCGAGWCDGAECSLAHILFFFSLQVQYECQVIHCVLYWKVLCYIIFLYQKFDGNDHPISLCHLDSWLLPCRLWTPKVAHYISNISLYFKYDIMLTYTIHYYNIHYTFSRSI